MIGIQPIQPKDHTIGGRTLAAQCLEQVALVEAVHQQFERDERLDRYRDEHADDIAAGRKTNFPEWGMTPDGALYDAAWLIVQHEYRRRRDSEVARARTFGDCDDCGGRHHNDEACAAQPPSADLVDAARAMAEAYVALSEADEEMNDVEWFAARRAYRRLVSALQNTPEVDDAE